MRQEPSPCWGGGTDLSRLPSGRELPAHLAPTSALWRGGGAGQPPRLAVQLRLREGGKGGSSLHLHINPVRWPSLPGETEARRTVARHPPVDPALGPGPLRWALASHVVSCSRPARSLTDPGCNDPVCLLLAASLCPSAAGEPQRQGPALPCAPHISAPGLAQMGLRRHWGE